MFDRSAFFSSLGTSLNHDDDYGIFYFGFGFSPILNDYKIVRVYFSYLVVRAEVFSLSDGSWKEIDVGSLERVRIYFEAVAFNGAIFWSGAVLEDEEDVDGVSVMVSFDLAKEVFTLIPLPPLPNIINCIPCSDVTIYSLTYRAPACTRTAIVQETSALCCLANGRRW